MVVRSPLRLLVALAALAVIVEVVATVGWWRWRVVAEVLRADAATGAEMLAEDPLLALPSAVKWSRRLSASDLRGADLQAARAAFERIGALQRRWLPTDPEGPKNEARATFLSGDLDGGVELLEAALRRDPTSAYLHRLAALMLRRAGRIEESLEHLAEARAIWPDLVHPAVELTPEDQERVALDGLRRGVELYPRDRVTGLLALAKRLDANGDEEGAVAALEPVAGKPDVELWLAERELRRGLPEIALERAGRFGASPLYPSLIRVRALSVVARARDMLGDPEGALAAATAAVELKSGSADPYLALASIAERRGEQRAALEHLRRARGVEPTNVDLLLRLARVAGEVGERAEVRATLERAVELVPDRPDVAARLVDHLLSSGQLIDATLKLSRFLERFPSDPRLLRQAERLRVEVGRAERSG